MSIPSKFLLVALLGVTAGCVSSSKYKRESDRAQSLEAQLAAARREKDELNSRLQAAEQEKTVTQQEVSRVKSERDEMVESLRKEVAAGQVKISEIEGQLQIAMVDKILFPSGSAQLKPEGEAVLRRVGEALRNIQGKDIWISGHTDNVPISGALKTRWPTNWELSAARATSVVRFLQDEAGLPPGRMIAAGRGEFHPVADNATPEGREQNRRIEILLVPSRPASEPAADNKPEEPAAQPAADRLPEEPEAR